MPAPSKLSIATSAVQRLVKEEASYHRELEQQTERVRKLEESSGNDDSAYQLKQERKAVEETRAIFPKLKQRIQDALAKLELQLEDNQESGGEADTEEVTKAKDAVAAAKTAIREAS